MVIDIISSAIGYIFIYTHIVSGTIRCIYNMHRVGQINLTKSKSKKISLCINSNTLFIILFLNKTICKYQACRMIIFCTHLFDYIMKGFIAGSAFRNQNLFSTRCELAQGLVSKVRNVVNLAICVDNGLGNKINFVINFR